MYSCWVKFQCLDLKVEKLCILEDKPTSRLIGHGCSPYRFITHFEYYSTYYQALIPFVCVLGQ